MCGFTIYKRDLVSFVIYPLYMQSFEGNEILLLVTLDSFFLERENFACFEEDKR